MTTRRRKLLFVSPHFPPDSSAASHRARILAPHLATYGWDTVVLTVDPAEIGGRLDPELASSIPTSVRVVRAPTTSLRKARVAGVGDLGIRALRGLYTEGRRLLANEAFDALLITTYPIYPAWLGPRFKAATGVPFVLDLQDPWVGAWGRTVGPRGRPDLRSRLSRRVAVALERTIAPDADALVAVSARTLGELASRVPEVRTRPLLELPIGWEPLDFSRPVRIRATRTSALVSYVGTLLPVGYDVAGAFLAGAYQLLSSGNVRAFQLSFVGTSNQTQYDGPPLLTGLVPAGMEPHVSEAPQRLPYFDAIEALRGSEVVLVLGTTEPHYTASKVYPALASRRPVLALLHEESQAAGVLRDAPGVVLVTFDGATPRDRLAARAADALRQTLALIEQGPFDRADILDRFSGAALAGQLAQLLDSVARRVGEALRV